MATVGRILSKSRTVTCFCRQLNTVTLRTLSSSSFIASRKLNFQSHNFLKPTTYEITVKAQYAAEWPLDIKQIGDRVMLTLKLYDKINPETLTYDTHFLNDVGLDSLDLVEVMLMIEDEFGFEIPDEHGERLLTPRKLVQYIADHEDVLE